MPNTSLTDGEPVRAAGALTRRSVLAGSAAAAVAVPTLGFASAASATSTRSGKTGPGSVLPSARDVLRKGKELADLELVEVASLLQAGAVSSRELVRAAYDRINKRDGDTNAWIHLYPEVAYKLAAAADNALVRARRGKGEVSLLTGVPIGLKDIIAAKDLPLTFGSDAFADHIAPGDATAWARLKKAGCVLLGHARTIEFATANAPQLVANPWDLTKSPGGSSNGPAAAVAARHVWLTLGTDSGGSLRRPSTLNNVSTIKATYGRVSTWGILTSSRNQDHVGPLARSIADCALALSYLAGPDPNDPPTLAAPDAPHLYPLRATSKSSKPYRGMVFGVTQTEPVLDDLEPGVRAVWDRFAARVTAMGARLVPIVSPERVGQSSGGPSPEAVAFQRLWFAERGHLYSEVNRTSAESTLARANEGTIIGYYDSLVARAQYIEAWKAVFTDNHLDAVITPNAIVEAPLKDTPLAAFGPNIRSYWNTLGFPVLGLPGGLSPVTGMPVGIQLAGLPFTETDLFTIALEYQERYPDHALVPPRYK